MGISVIENVNPDKFLLPIFSLSKFKAALRE